MTKKSKIFFSFFLLQFAVCHLSFAQYSITPTFIGSTGSSGTVSGMHISYSVGEAVIATFTVGAGPTVRTITQGFQQPEDGACPTASTLSVFPNAPVCEGTNVTMDVVSTGGTGPFTYIWSSGQTTTVSSLVVAPTITTGYTFTIDGCASNTGTHTVTVIPTPSTPTATATPNPICAGQDLALNASTIAGATYSWSGPNGFTSATQNPFIFGIATSEAGTYSVMATISGCSGPAGTVSVSIAPAPTLSLTTTNVLCAADCNGTATAIPIGGIPPFSYLWSIAGPTTSSISNICPAPISVTVTSGGGCTASANGVISAPPALTVSVIATQPNCGINGVVSATPGGGTPGYSYQWSPGGATTQTVSGIGTGFHSVVVSDLNGCTVNSGVNITASPGVTIITSPSSATICAGTITSIGASASGGANYLWSPGGGTTNIIQISPTAPTTYTVIATDPISGCSDTAYVPITVNPLPSAAITGNTSICSGQSTTLTAAAGGTSYSWIPANINQVFLTGSLSSNTGYTVTVTDAANCTAVGTTTVFVSPSPTASITATPSSVCSGGTITLTASGGSTYFWINNSSSAAQIIETPIGNTTYTLIAFNGSCSDTTTLAVPISSVSVVVSGTNSLCIGQSTTLTATPTGGNAPYTYAWNTTPPQTTPSIIETYTATGTFNYSVSITDGFGCNGSATYSVVVNSLPAVSISASSSTVCAGSPSILTASPASGVTYAWSTGETTNPITVSPLSPSTYSVTVSNGSCSSSTTINISVNALPTISAAANPATICAGDTAYLSASGNAIGYSWNTGATTASTFATPGISTSYTVVGTDANSCSNFSTVLVTLNTISVDAGADMTICPGFTATLNAVVTGSTSGVSYLWSPPQFLNDPAVPDPSATPDTTTMFVVTVTNGSCTAIDSVLVHTIRTPSCVIHVYNGITPNGDNDNNTWFIDGIQSYPINRVIIFNRWGNKIWDAEGYNNKDIVWKGTDQQGNILADGTYYYLVELFDGDGGTIFSETSWVEVTQ